MKSAPSALKRSKTKPLSASIVPSFWMARTGIFITLPLSPQTRQTLCPSISARRLSSSCFSASARLPYFLFGRARSFPWSGKSALPLSSYDSH